MTCAHASAKPLSGEGGGRSECQQQSDCREKHRAGTCRGAGRIQVHVGRCGRGGRDPANHTHGHHQQPVSNPNAAGPGSPAVSARQLLEIRRHSVAAGACAVRPVASHLAAGAAYAHVGSHHNVLVQAASRLDETLLCAWEPRLSPRRPWGALEGLGSSWDGLGQPGRALGLGYGK